MDRRGCDSSLTGARVGGDGSARRTRSLLHKVWRHERQFVLASGEFLAMVECPEGYRSGSQTVSDLRSSLLVTVAIALGALSALTASAETTERNWSAEMDRMFHYCREQTLSNPVMMDALTRAGKTVNGLCECIASNFVAALPDRLARPPCGAKQRQRQKWIACTAGLEHFVRSCQDDEHDMTDRLTEFDHEPCPPYPDSTLKRIGEFFWLFSILEEWIRSYLKDNGDCSPDSISDKPLPELLKFWPKIAQRAEPDNPCILALCGLLKELCEDRNATAHAWWCQHEERLHGRFTRKRDKEVIPISGDEGLDEMIAKAKHCTAIIDFW
jgi:hypothetical protein